MAKFSDLPDELLLLVCHHLLLLVPNRELLGLSRVNWRLNRLTLPLFWRDVQIPDSQLLNLKLYAAIILRDRIAPLIKSIRFGGGYKRPAIKDCGEESESGGQKSRDGDKKVTEGLVERVADIFKGDLQLGQKWRQAVESREVAFMVPLLLVHLSGLERLTCRQWQDSQWVVAKDLWSALEEITNQMVGDDRIAADKKPFVRLREASIDAIGQSTSNISLAVMAHWPAIESLQIARIGDTRWLTSAFDKLEPDSLKLKSIHLLNRHNLAPSHLYPLLCASSNLRAFQFQLNEHWNHADKHLDLVQKGLERSNEKLQHVTLYTPPSVTHVRHGTYSGYYLIDYSQFKRLTHLCVGYIFFFGVQVRIKPYQALNKRLPRSIVKLQIIQVREKSRKTVRCGLDGLFSPDRQNLVAPDPPREFPDLKTIDIGVYPEPDSETAKFLQKCRWIGPPGEEDKIRLQYFDYQDPKGTDEPLLTQFGVPEDVHPDIF